MDDNRFRLAPSPTGFLHIGNLRTALFGYLLAKTKKGKFILRIEDTDQKREVDGAVESLISILDWIGIKFDEGPNMGGGYGPYIQTKRLNIYKEHIDKLLAEKKAYYCFCSSERLDKMRKNQIDNKQAPKYDKKCRHLSLKEIEKRIKAGEKYVIRQKMPENGKIVVHDELRGDIIFKAEELEDHVLVKSNGIPTYQLANVIDDYLMGITHVTRGEEWIPSSPKNVLLYQAFGWKIPKFIHLPLILNKTGGKLSKRQGDVFVEDFKRAGYLPEALINFCALLGWHPKGDNEILSMHDLEKQFNIQGMGSSPAVFDLEKLDYYNGYYIRQMDTDKLTELCKPYLMELAKTAKPEQQTDEYLRKIVKLEKARLKKISDIINKTKYFFVQELDYNPELLIWKKSDKLGAKNCLKQTLEQLDNLTEKHWTQASLEETMMTYIKSKKEGVGDFLWPMRVALTGEKNSPSPFEVAETLGKKLSLIRIKQAINLL